MPSAEDWAKALAEQIVTLMDEAKASKATARALKDQISQSKMEAKTAKARAEALQKEVAKASTEAKTAKARAKALQSKAVEAQAQAQAAEAQAVTLGDQLIKAQAEVEAERYANAKSVAVYPAGRYECKACGQSVMFTSDTVTLPQCHNCGSQEYKGHEPKMKKVLPEPGKKHQPGMYQCGSCGARVAVAVATNTLPACDLCGQTGLVPVE